MKKESTHAIFRYFWGITLLLMSMAACSGNHDLKRLFPGGSAFSADTMKMNATVLAFDRMSVIPDSLHHLIDEGFQLIRKDDPDYATYDIKYHFFEHRYWKAKGDTTKALKLLKEAQQIALKFKDCEMARCLTYMKRLEPAFDLPAQVDSMANLYINSGNAKCAPRFYSKMGEYFVGQNQYDNAIGAFQKGVVIAEKHKLYEPCAEIQGWIGRCYFDQENYVEALKHYEMVGQYAGKVPENLITISESGIANCYLMLGKRNEAIEMLYKVKLKYEKAKNYLGIANVTNNIGACYHEQNQFEEAKKIFQEAIAFYENSKIQTRDVELSIADAYNNLGTEYSHLKKYREADGAFQKSVAIDEKQLPINPGLATKYALLANNYVKLGDNAAAEKYYAKSMAVPLADNMAMDQIARLMNYGNYLVDAGRAKEALPMLQQALQIAQTNKLDSGKKSCTESLYKAHKQLGQTYLALQYHEQFRAIQDSVLNEETLSELTKQKLIYEHQKYKDEKTNEIMTLRSNALSSQRNMLLTALCGILALFAAVFLRTKLKQEKTVNELLTEKNTALESELKNKLTLISYNLKNMESLTQFVHESGGIDPTVKRKMLKVIDDNQNKEWIKKIDYQFVNLHEKFYQTLVRSYPDLTPNNLKLCTYLKMNLTTKEIAALQFTTTDSVSKAKTRLKEKLGIEGSDISLTTFLNSI